MQAIRFHEYSDIDVLRYEEAPTPRPGPGEVLVAVAATAFNPVDRFFRAGAMDEILPVRFPHTLGLYLAGTVVEHGTGVDDPAIGTEVIGFLPMTGPGAAAEYVTAPAEVLVRAPATIPLIDAAATSSSRAEP
jgi:NADPH:quinone reductase-like Zn-dependent oxidoreductase